MSFRGGRGGRGGGGRGGGLGGRSGPMTEEERNAGSFAFPTDTYPKTSGVPIAAAATREERFGAAHFLRFRTEIRDGPLYTGDALTAGKKKRGGAGASVVIEIEESNGTGGGSGALNDGIKRYTDKYHKKRKAGRSVDEHPYVIDFFPKELYDAMGVVEAENSEDDDEDVNGADGRTKKKPKRGKKYVAKKLDITKFRSELIKTSAAAVGVDGDLDLDDLEALLESGGVVDEESRKRAIENIKKDQALNPDEPGKDLAKSGKDEDDENVSEGGDLDLEDSFDDDDDDDYNAEKYFDDGDGGDDDDGNDEAAY